ncbi:hypothetical protein F5141DRAFT_1062239 [Pisolithus sp. B1]|nr:hypothetical protein F5141DRAFT_1062239 [Pisolithus sp. B1]
MDQEVSEGWAEVLKVVQEHGKSTVVSDHVQGCSSVSSVEKHGKAVVENEVAQAVAMQHGCPKKPKCNISGLCVQGQPLPTLDDAGDTTKIDLETENLELKWAVPPNDLMIDFWREYEGKSTTDELDMVEEQDLGFLDGEEFGWRLQVMAEKADSQDLDWIPEWLQRKQKSMSCSTNVTEMGLKLSI